MTWTKKQKRLFDEINQQFRDFKIPKFEPLENDVASLYPILSKVDDFELYDTVRHPIYGLGTVIEIKNFYGIDVDFDEYNPNLHSLNGRCLDGHGCCCRKIDVEKIG